MMKPGEDYQKWQFSGGDTFSDAKIAHFADKHGILQLYLLTAINMADEAASGLTLHQLSSLTTCCRDSMLLRLAPRLPAASRQIALELWDIFRHVGGFCSSSVLLWEDLRKGAFMTLLPHFQILPGIELADIELAKFDKRYRLSVNTDFLTNFPPEIDFYNILKFRAEMKKGKLTSQRRDWLEQYPLLCDWISVDPDKGKPSLTTHCEVKLALSCLQQGRVNNLVIGVSKNPCFCCEKFFGALNMVAKHVNFIIAPGHKKVYQCWMLSGLREIDKSVAGEVWAEVNEMMAELTHSENKDVVTGISARSIKPDFETLVDMTMFTGFLAKLNTLGYLRSSNQKD